MIEITVRDTEDNFIKKITGDLAYFTVVNKNEVYSQIRGRGNEIDLMQLYTELKDTAKDLESDNPIIKILEGLCNKKRTKYDLSPIEKMKKEED